MHNLEQLEELARDNSTSGRSELLRMLTDMFLDNIDSGSEEQGEVFADIVSRVLDDLVEEARASYASRVAVAEQFPKDVVIKLAWDTFEVASPILEHSAVLTDEDLVEIANRQSDEHLMAISRRSELREIVTDVLVERGSDGVVHSVAANPGAQFSAEGYQTLATKAQLDKKLQEALVARADVTRDVADKLEPYLSAQLKKRLEKTLNASPGDVTKLVTKAKERVEKALVGKKRDQADADIAVQQIKSGEISLDEAIIRFASERRPVPLSTLISATAELPEKMVANALLKVNGMPVAVTCRALNISPHAFAEVANMRCAVLRLPESTGERLAAQYAELDQADAERTLRFLRVRQSLNENVA